MVDTVKLMHFYRLVCLLLRLCFFITIHSQLQKERHILVQNFHPCGLSGTAQLLHLSASGFLIQVLTGTVLCKVKDFESFFYDRLLCCRNLQLILHRPLPYAVLLEIFPCAFPQGFFPCAHFLGR